MKQKCEVWGLKVRGVAESMEKAKAMTQKLMRIDNDYDIYTVEVGKFFPLAVEPTAVGEVEYQNSQLNDLIKSYLENREMANEQWEARKNEMIKAAIREGKNQEAASSKPEHPIAVLQRIKSFTDAAKELQEQLDSVQKDLKLSHEKFLLYTEEEKQQAQRELDSAVSNALEASPVQTDMSLDEIRTKLIEDLSPLQQTDSGSDEVQKILDELKTYEDELQELHALKRSLDQSVSPNVYKRTLDSIHSMESKIQDLKTKLNNTKTINSFINSQYQSSSYSVLDSPEPSRSAPAL